MLLTLWASLSILGLSSGLECNDGNIRGVNLGGLFLLEPWITPKFFENFNKNFSDQVVDEYTFHQLVSPNAVHPDLEAHWASFYSESDLQELVTMGISHVRIPVPYWLVDVEPGEPFPPPPADDTIGMRKYFKQVMTWCERVGLKVLVDLHGAPMSQNGFDNSGRRGPVGWYSGSNGDLTHVDRTVLIIEKLSFLLLGWIQDATISESTLDGIAILNEPAAWDEALWTEIRDDFHFRAYDAVRKYLPDPGKFRVVIQQAFRNPGDFDGYMSENDGYYNVALDMHNYHAFGGWNDVAQQPDGWQQNLAAACDYPNYIGHQTLNTFTGEWSLAVTDCQKYLDGGYANPYDPVAINSTCEYYDSDFDNFPPEYISFLRDFMLAQMDAYEQAWDGWYFWTAKTEDNCAPEWDYLFLARNGIAPLNLCNRPTYCQFP